MGEARRRRLFGVHLRPAVDIDVAIEDLEKWVEADKVTGWVQIVKLENVAPSVYPVKLYTFGLEKQEAYDVLCEMKDAMEQTMGFKEKD